MSKVRHLVAWQFDPKFTKEQNLEHAKRAKQELEELPKVIPGLLSLTLHIHLLESSTATALLDSVFESQQALKDYQSHPAHQEAASFVRSVTQNRMCVDYLEA